jgi:FkbM family methyltransferase
VRPLGKPHYVFRPTQLLRRLLRREAVRTPWTRMRVADDVLGRGLVRTGVHELAVSETIWRLADPGDLAVDVGANVGYFTGLLTRRVREVIALEPNPRLWPIVSENVAAWGGKIELLAAAASDTSGHSQLHLPADWGENHGIATLEAGDGESYEVTTVRLEDLIAGREVGILKIDVEGHELKALTGAPLELIRDLVFEEHEPLPSPVSALLAGAGFEIRGIEESFLRPRLVERRPESWDAPTYLATRDLPRAQRRLAGRGWRCLLPRRSARR